MFLSKNTFFKQTDIKLKLEGKNLVRLLQIKGRSMEEIRNYVKAYLFFTKNPYKYKGVDFLNGLFDIGCGGKRLDVDTMLHTYDYINGANINFKKKWKADIKYIKNMKKNGKGLKIIKFIFITFTGIFTVPCTIITKRFFKNNRV